MELPGDQLGGPHAAVLEELRQRIFDGSKGRALADDPRAELLYEKIAELLEMDEPLSPPPTGTLSCISDSAVGMPGILVPASPTASPSQERQRRWSEYVATTLASIKRRETLLDIQGQPRVTRVFCAPSDASSLSAQQALLAQTGAGTGGTGGAPPVPLHHVDLADWRGRHRVRVLYDGFADPLEIRQCNTSGGETVYTSADFEPEPAFFLEGQGLSSLASRLERARQSAALLRHADAAAAAAGNAAPVATGGCSGTAAAGAGDAERAALQSIEALCNEVFPRLDKLLQRERDEGRQLVPCSEDLLEMELERVVELLEAPGAS